MDLLRSGNLDEDGHRHPCNPDLPGGRQVLYAVLSPFRDGFQHPAGQRGRETEDLLPKDDGTPADRPAAYLLPLERGHPHALCRLRHAAPAIPQTVHQRHTLRCCRLPSASRPFGSPFRDPAGRSHRGRTMAALRALRYHGSQFRDLAFRCAQLQGSASVPSPGCSGTPMGVRDQPPLFQGDGALPGRVCRGPGTHLCRHSGAPGSPEEDPPLVVFFHLAYNVISSVPLYSVYSLPPA